MVIDKWTKTANSNVSLSIPLLDHKSNESFIDIKNKYERLKQLNHYFKKNINRSISGAPNINPGNNILDIKNYLEQINLILISLDELISEKLNFGSENKSLYDDIDLEFEIFIENMTQFGRKNKNIYFDINSYLNKSQTLINKIYKKMNKNKVIENIIFQNDENRIRANINPNIDRGHINILTKKREFHNSITFEGRNVQYTVEQDSFSNIIKIILFFLVICFIMFICYICML